jgi:hypothetical protein
MRAFTMMVARVLYGSGSECRVHDSSSQPMTKRKRLTFCLTTGCVSHLRSCHFGGPRRWPACAERLAAALGGGGELRVHRLHAPWLAFDCTALSLADDERGRLAICQTTGWLSHVRTCHFSICDVGRHVLDVWQRLLAVGVNHAFTDCPHCDRPSTARLFLLPMTSGDVLQSA